MRTYCGCIKFSLCSAVAVVLAALLVTACTSTGAAGGRRSPNRELPQYSQKGWKSVKIVGGGMIPGIIFNTSHKGVAYVRTDMGGAYRWNPENESWIPLTDFAGVEDYGRLGIPSIATDPVEPNRVIIASGTYTNSWDGTPSQMLVSEDYGDTFTRVDMPFKMGGNMPGRGAGERLAIDPNDNKTVYFGSFGDGLWRSRDYGHTWEEVKSFPTKGNIYDNDFTFYVDQNFKHFHGIMWVIFDPASGTKGEGSKNIYVGVADTRYTIYESADAGETWHPLEGQPINKMGSAQEHAHLVENCPCGNYYPIRGIYSPEGALITAWNAGFGPYSSSYQGGGIWKYRFAEKQWEDISLPKHDFDQSSPDRPIDRGVGCVAVDAQNPQTLIAVTLNEWWPDEYIYRSRDGGKSWDPIWFLDGWPDRVNKYTLDISVAPWLDWGEQKELPEQNPKLGWCIACIVIDPFNSDVMMYGTGATIYGSKNLSEWDKNRRIKIEVMAEGIEECAILDLVSPTEGPHLISAMGDIGGFIHRDLNRSPNMIVNPKIDGVNSVDYAAAKPSYMVRVGGDGFDDESRASKLGISSDSGRTWKPAEKFIEGAQAGWSSMAAVSADARIIIWAPGNLPPSWTSNEGRTWTLCTGLPSGVKVAADRVNPNKFYAFGKSEGERSAVWVSADSGRTFTVANDNLFTGGVSGEVWSQERKNFKAVVGMEGHLWLAAGEEGLYHSMDGGVNWKHIEGFDTVPIIGLGMAAPGETYQALYTNAKRDGQWGIYRSDNRGTSWVRINDDTHQFGAATTAITGDPRVYGRVYLATNGRGIQYRDLE